MTVTVTDCGDDMVHSVPAIDTVSISNTPVAGVPAETTVPAVATSVESTGSVPSVAASSTEVSTTPRAATESGTPSATETPSGSATAPGAETTYTGAAYNNEVDNALFGGVLGLAVLLAL